MTVKFTRAYLVSAIKVIGSALVEFYTNTFTVEWKNDTTNPTFTAATASYRGDSLFDGANSSCVANTRTFSPAFWATEMRILPQTWGPEHLTLDAAGMRFEILACQNDP